MVSQLSLLPQQQNSESYADDLPSPRERLLRDSASTISDRELLEIIGGPTIASYVAETGRCLYSVITADPAELARALPSRTAAAVIATREILHRISRSALPDREPLAHPAAVARYLALRYSRSDQEVMGAIFLDTRNRLLSDSEIYRGTLNRAAVEPRAILKEALLRGAAGVIVFHTHPSGDPSPSAEDLAFTRRLAEAGEVVGIRLVDHLIVASTTAWVSLRERRAW